MQFSLSLVLFALGAIYCVHVVRIFWQISFPPTAIYTPSPDLIRYGFEEGDDLTLEVRVSNSPYYRVPLVMEKNNPPIWQTQISYGSSFAKISTNITVNVTVSNPDSKNPVYLWAYITKTGYSPNSEDRGKFKQYLTATQVTPFQLIEFLPPKTERSLLNEEAKDVAASTTEPHYKPRAVVRLVHEEAYYPLDSPVHGPSSFDKRARRIYPVVMFDEMWITRDDFKSLQSEYSSAPSNNHVVSFPLTVEYEPIGAPLFRVYSVIQTSIAQQTRMLGGSQKEMDEVKLMLVENSPVVLLVTVVISVFHLIFEFLSLKNDVVFWSRQKSLAGISLRALALQTVSKLVVMLYLRDQDTNILVVLGVGLDLLVSMWKLVSAVDWQVSARFPFVVVHTQASYRGLTDEMDKYALMQLSKILGPLMIGYLVYSLVYEKHKGWYGFVISWLASCVYGFGFILMTPQLFLNYKLKSVAHLPWRAMVYRFINTFIDDVFAFIIRMPTMHRVSVLRDDVVFFIYLYQRWIYPIDNTRVHDLDDSTEPQPATEAETNQASEDSKKTK